MDENRDLGLNYGVLIDEPIASDWAASVLPWEDIGADWRDYGSIEERQSNIYMDDMACMIRSALNVIEVIHNYQYQNGLLPSKQRQFLEDERYVVNGTINYSDRFTSIMSGTTEHGNYGSRVWDTIRNIGLVPEADLAFEGHFRWNDYYIPIKDIPQAVRDKATRWQELFDVQYSRLIQGIENYDEDLINHHLKHAPLQIITRVCPGWHTDSPVKACQTYPTQHATALLYNDNKGKHIEDHYIPFNKLLAKDYKIPFIYKAIVESKEEDNMTLGQATMIVTGMYVSLLSRQPKTTEANAVKGHAVKLMNDVNKASQVGINQVYSGFLPEIRSKLKQDIIEKINQV